MGWMWGSSIRGPPAYRDPASVGVAGGTYVASLAAIEAFRAMGVERFVDDWRHLHSTCAPCIDPRHCIDLDRPALDLGGGGV